MAIAEKMIDGELHLVVETSEDFVRALDRDLPINAPPLRPMNSPRNMSMSGSN